LLLAIDNGHVDVVEILVKYGVDVNQMDKKKETSPLINSTCLQEDGSFFSFFFFFFFFSNLNTIFFLNRYLFSFGKYKWIKFKFTRY